ncbi:MAG: diacylglycerol kinase family lipid kinase [Anaerolineae bacterium]|nr:diacylglycerol kinase family lipid kinase [Anaerolineae bacterium]
MRAKVVLNPITGRGTGARAAPIVQSELRRRGIDFDLVVTKRPGHAIQLAREAALSGYDSVIAVGGDGTVNEVVNGLIAAAQSQGRWDRGEPAGTLGVIPVGSGNDFAYALGLHARDIPGACDRIAAGQERVVDIAHVTDERATELYFCNNVGIGFDAAVNIEARKIKRLRGFLLYFVALLRTVLLYHHAPVTRVVYSSGHMQRPLMLISVANGPRTGGGFMIAPRAQVNDGLLDLCIVDRVSRLGILQLIPHFIRGTHEDKPAIHMERSVHVLIEIEDGLPVHVDGEVFHTAARRLEIHIWQRRLRVLT